MNQSQNRGCGCTGVLALFAILVMLVTPGWQLPMLAVLAASGIIGALYLYLQIQQRQRQAAAIPAQIARREAQAPAVPRPPVAPQTDAPSATWGGRDVPGFCTYCGTPFAADAQYCRKCGRPVTR